MNLISELKQRLDDAELWEKELQLKRKEYLCVPGSIETHLYYVVEGSLRVYMEDEFEQHVIRLGYQGNFIAALDSFISEQPSGIYIQALKKSTILSVQKARYVRFLHSSAENMALWQTMMEQLLLQQLEREKDILISSPRDRYQRVLKRSPQLFELIPLKHIASYLRMTPETLSRLRKS